MHSQLPSRTLFAAVLIACAPFLAEAQTLEVGLVPSVHNGYHISCFGGRDGAIDATISGGTAPYNLNWSNGASTEDITDLASGYYRLKISDANNVEAEAEVTLVEPTALRIGVVPFQYPSGHNISCPDCFNGSIDVTVTEGVAPYTYDWGDEVYTPDRTGLGAMNYAVDVIDANGCAAKSEPVFLTQPDRDDWRKDGNANTDPNIHYFGTSDEKDVVFKSNGVERLRLTSGGQVKLLGLGGAGVLGIDAEGVVGPVPGIGLNPIDPPPCAQDVFPFWRTGGNELTTCDPSRAVLGSLDARHVNFITNNDVRMRLTSSGQLQVGGDLEEWPETDAAGRVNILQGNGNWLTLKTQGATPGAPSSFWGLHNPPEQDRLMFYHHPVSGDALFDVLTLHDNGKVSIGDVNVDTGDYDYGLYVHNGILTEKVKVALKTSADWSDDVFRKDYVLMPLEDVRKHIAEHGHLPGVLSANEMVERGLDVVATDAMLLRKIEELTLHIIAQEARIKELEKH